MRSSSAAAPLHKICAQRSAHLHKACMRVPLGQD
jgi:hypothetical protein